MSEIEKVNEIKISSKAAIRSVDAKLTEDAFGVKVARTILLWVSWICMGMYSEITGPTLQNLMTRVNSNYEEISRALVARSVGFFAGSLIAGLICQRWSRLTDIWISLALILAAVATAFAPWCRNLALLGFLFCLDGTAKGILAVAANSNVFILWKEKAAMPTQALHFAFGIGALSAPQICRPFLPHSDESTTTVTPIPSTTEPTGRIEYDIEKPYFIVAGITLSVAIAFIPLFIMYPPKTYTKPEADATCIRSLLNMFSPKSCFTGSKTLGIPFIILNLVFFSLPVGAERAYGKFIFSFSTDQLGFSADGAATLETVFWASFTAGRGLATLLAVWVPPTILLLVELIVHLTSTSLLSALGGSNTIVLWICSGLFGACMAPLFPTAIVWANTVMDMTALLTSFSFIAAACGAFAFSWISGALFEYYGPITLMYFMLSYAIFATLLFIILYLVSKKMKTTYEVKNDKYRMERTEFTESPPCPTQINASSTTW